MTLLGIVIVLILALYGLADLGRAVRESEKHQ